jgi:hypothetical protein
MLAGIMASQCAHICDGPAPVVCEDLATDCAEKVTRRNAKRKCQFRPKLKEQCPRSCGLCDTP